MLVRDFIKSETGAVTVDWVILSGSVVGLGLAVTAVVADGVGSLSNEISADLSGMDAPDIFDEVMASLNFEDGTTGAFVGGTVTDGGMGNVLQGGGSNGNQEARAVFDLEDGADYAVLTFDVHAIDSWDGESFNVFVNDQVVSSTEFNNFTDGDPNTWSTSNPNVTFEMVPTTSRNHSGYNATFVDQSYQVRVTVADPGNQVSLGFGSTLDQGMDDESWAVDNVTVVSTDTI